MEIHAHTAGCFGEAGELLCGQADFVLHTHGEFCYNADGELACTLPEIEEHRHTAGCYSEEETLICGEQETAGHQHGEDCYETTLEPVCGRKETAGHQHDDGCYAERALLCTDETHEHTDDCYEQEPALICGHEAGEGMHIHDESCCEAVHTLICALAESESGHVHTDACYERETVLTCGEEEFSLHAHDSACYGADGALICGQLAVSEHTHTENCCAYVQRPPEEVLEAEELLEQPALLAAKATGSSFTFKYDKCTIQFNLVDEADNSLTAATVENVTAKDKKNYSFDSSFAPEIEGYTYIGAKYGENNVYSVATEDYDQDKVNGKVSYIRFYTTETIQENEYINKTKDECKNAGTFTVNLIYREKPAITFTCVDADGNELEAQTQKIYASDNMNHQFKDYAPEISGFEYLWASIENKYLVSYVTNSGNTTSPFLLHFSESSDLFYTKGSIEVTLHYADADEMRSSFTMQYPYDARGNNATITFNLVDTKGLPLEAKVHDFIGDVSTRYIFGAADASTEATDRVAENIAPEIAGYDYQGATYVDPYTANAAAVPVYSVATTGYKNGANSTFTGTFQIYNSEPFVKDGWYSNDTSPTITLIYSEPTDYTGDWAIVNLKRGQSTGAAMLAGSSSFNSLETRAGVNVTVTKQNGENYAYETDTPITLWHFEKQKDGNYYISIGEGNEKQYLNIGYDGNYPDEAVTLSSSPQSIAVLEGSGEYAGMVCLVDATRDDGRGVNLFVGSAQNGFGCYSEHDANSWHTLCKVSNEAMSTLRYNLAVTKTRVGTYIIDGTNWEEPPEVTPTDGTEIDLTDPTQVITGAGTLYGPGTPGADGYFTFAGQLRLPLRRQLGNVGKDFRFDGWTATDVNGEPCTFAQNALATVQTDGSIKITDTDKIERTLSSGTMLTAKWTQVSDMVLFYVNYGGTILDVETDVRLRAQSEFTGIIAVGKIYFGEQIVGVDDVLATEVDQQIRDVIVPEYDPDKPGTQVVLQYVTAYDNSELEHDEADDKTTNNGKGYNIYNSAVGYNATMLEGQLLEFIQDNNFINIQISNEEGTRPTIVNENATPDNYEVRWYVLKDQNDAWHIDGVMVAKTKPVTVTKTFSGLESTQVNSLLPTYQIPVKLGADKQNYFTMTTTTPGNQNYYSYSGSENQIGQSYEWTMNAIQDEQYTLSEDNYGVTGYDVSTIVVHYYKDENGDHVLSKSAPTTEGLNQPVVGGKTTAVSFNNFYTETGTGALAIHKSSTNGAALQGAVFMLTDKKGNVVATETSNSRGSVYFNNLEKGTYTLKETKAPDGYEASDEKWTVEVEKDKNDVVEVTVTDSKDKKTVCYQTETITIYEIRNKPKQQTVTITKTFSGLKSKDMEGIYKNSTEDKDKTNPYFIELLDQDGNRVKDPLYLKGNRAGQDNYHFEWTLSEVNLNETYQIVEHNYLYDRDDEETPYDYKDVAVTAKVNGTACDVTVDRTVSFGKATTSEFTFDQTSTSNKVEITNHYTDTFKLELKKVDAVTKSPLTGAEFELYGPFAEATNTSKEIEYSISGESKKQKAYYITTVTVDKDGIAVVDGLSLSELSEKYTYVLKETVAPTGYVTQTIPPFTVEVDSEGYAHGVYTLTVENSKGSLPETGGAGTLPFILGGALLAAGSLLYGYQLRRRRERRSTP